jgi:REP element-mobilizing transposase RayT
MTFNPNLHHRRSIRLRDYDYSSGGYYFVTICTHGRICYFGDIHDAAVSLSPVGEIAHQYWQDIPVHFDNVDIDEFIIMPNHIHGIIIINDDTVGARHGMPLQQTNKFGVSIPNSLSVIINQYKSSLTRWCNQNDHPFAWQRNYHEHIIRDDADLDRIREYIINNPMNWENDEDFI